MALYSTLDTYNSYLCPFCKASVSARRWPYHKVKCLRKHPESKYTTCVFNARHEIPSDQYLNHIANCPDRSKVPYQIQQMMYELKGSTDVPAYNSDWSRGDDWDDWDDHETCQPEPRQSRIQGLPEAKGVKFNDGTPKIPTVTEAPIRLPVQEPQITSSTYNTNRSGIVNGTLKNPVYSVCMQGIGRGRALKLQTDHRNHENLPSFVQNNPAGRGTYNPESTNAATKCDNKNSDFLDDAEDLAKSLAALSIGRGKRILQYRQ